MRCLVCHSKIIKNRTIWTLFDNIKGYICDSCKTKYPITPEVEVLPCEGGLIFVVTLFKHYYPTTLFDAYMNEYDVIFKWIEKKEGILLFVEYLDDELIEILENLDFGNILIIASRRITTP